MADVLRFVSPLTNTVQPQTVYWKTRLQDPWVEVRELWASETVWAVAPTIPTASLQFRYGFELHRFAPQWAPVFRARNRLRQYVRIEHIVSPINDDDTSTFIRTWHGILNIELDAEDAPFRQVNEAGEVIFYANGKVHFTAYGLASLLDEADCTRTRIAGGSGSFEVARAIGFRRNPRSTEHKTHTANRSVAADSDGVFLFHGEKTAGLDWTTQQAAAYVLAHDTPRDHAGEAVLKFRLHDPDGILPDWDQVELPREGRTAWELLNSLIARQRLIGFDVRLEEGPEETGGEIMIVPHSLTGTELVIESLSGAYFKANPRQKILALEKDYGALVSLKRTSADQYDQVLLIGAPRTSTATFSFIQLTIGIGWPAALEILYEAGGSLHADYPAAAEIEGRMLWNEEARKADNLKPVYARFVLPDPFDGYVGDGTSVLDAGEGVPLQPSDADPNVPNPLAPDDRRFLPQLPLLEGYDYSGSLLASSPTETGPAPHKHLKPLVLFRRGDWTEAKPRYRHAESAGLAAELETAGMQAADTWSSRVHVDQKDGALWIEVSNDPQEVIAKTDFTRLAEDPEVFADYRQMLATLAVPWSQHCSGIYPVEGTFGLDTNRVLRIDAGDEFRCDYVVPDTVVALDTGGQLVRTTTGGYVRDDRTLLTALAQLAWQWYGQVRRSLSFSTSLVNNALELGDFIVSTGDPDIEGDVHVDEVNSVISQIRIVSPLSEGEGPLEPTPPKIHYESAYGELDVLKLR